MLDTQQNLFKMIKAENFTNLTMEYNRQNGDLQLTLKKEWSKKVEWEKQDKKILKRIKKIQNVEVRKLALQYHLDTYLDEVIYLVKSGQHERVVWYYDPINDARCIVAIHNSQRPFTVGNIRRTRMAKPEYDVVVETLNLSRAISFRSAVGNLEIGGSYLNFQGPATDETNRKTIFGFLAYIADSEDVKWGMEPGFSNEEVELLQNEAQHIIRAEDDQEQQATVCATTSIYLAITESLQVRYGNSEIGGKLIGVQGLGRIGRCLAEKLLSEGADLIVCDVNPDRVDSFLKANKKYQKSISVVSSSEITMQMGHVFSPCAQGGLLSRDSMREIAYHIIVGGALQVLYATTQEEEITLANRLMKKGMLYVPDWISNIGALMYVSALIRKEPTDINSICLSMEEVYKPYLREILQNSKVNNTSVVEEAYKKFEAIVYSL